MAEQTPHRQQMTELCRRFPSLRDETPGVVPFDANKLDEWAATNAEIIAGSLMAVRFVLHVWNDTEECKSGAFSLREALARMDKGHRRVIAGWVADPFFP